MLARATLASVTNKLALHWLITIDLYFLLMDSWCRGQLPLHGDSGTQAPSHPIPFGPLNPKPAGAEGEGRKNTLAS